MPSSGWQQEIEAPCLCPTLLTTLPTLLLLLLQGSTSLLLLQGSISLLLLQGSSVSTVSYSSASTHGSDDTLDRDHQAGGGQGGGGLVARIRRLSGIRRQDRDTRPR